MVNKKSTSLCGALKEKDGAHWRRSVQDNIILVILHHELHFSGLNLSYMCTISFFNPFFHFSVTQRRAFGIVFGLLRETFVIPIEKCRMFFPHLDLTNGDRICRRIVFSGRHVTFYKGEDQTSNGFTDTRETFQLDIFSLA